MRKRILALLLSVTMLLTVEIPIFAEEPEESVETAETAEAVNVPKVGDTVWIRSGSKIYKSPEESDGYTVWFSHKIRIEEIVADDNGNPVWYEFTFQDWVSGLLKDYSYIKAADTASNEEEAEDPKECNCENPPENLAEHDDSCPRKQYVKSLITDEEGNYQTARGIYGDWETYDEATQTDILNLLEAEVYTTYDELLKMLNGFYSETFEGTLNDQVQVTVLAGADAFPENSKMTVKEAAVEENEIKGLISEDADILKIVAADISFGCQPTKPVSVSINISDQEMPENANRYYVIHLGTNGPELVTSAYLDTLGKGQTIPFTAESFSTYVVVLVNNKYPAKLMREVLKDDLRYTVKTLKANLFDYDGAVLNEKLLEAGNGNGFVFPAVGGFSNSIYQGINLGGSTAKQGILEDTLQNGLPVFNYLGNGGVTTGQILFDPTYKVAGKEIYENVDFEFIYDKTNGYYTYNSAWNHAQLNRSENKVELYADTLSMANEFAAVADLSQAYETNQMTNISRSKDSFKAEIHTDNTIDPFVCFPISAAADKVQNIRVRAKIIPKNGGDFSSAFTIYFSKEGNGGFQEGQTITAKYSASGEEWIDLVFDTAECANWKGTITGIRLDPIQDITSKNMDFTFEVAWIQLDEKNGIGTDYRNGGYYPFSDISASVPGRADQFDLETWKNNISSNYRGTAFANRAIFNTDGDKQAHLAFGTVIEQDFYIPVSQKSDFGKDIVFDFTGDDDLWVFIDDELVLDIGGGHTPVTGTINFTKKTTYVDKAVQITGYDTPNTEDGSKEQKGTLKAALGAPGMHTLKIFYMERHSGVSNCLMKFNFPLVPNGSVEVSKEVQDLEGKGIDVLKNDTFTFQISGEMLNETGTPLDFANLTYSVLDTATGKTTTEQTGEDGTFQLTATQKAYFDIPENYKVKVEEIEPSTKTSHGYQWISKKVTLTKTGQVQNVQNSEITIQKGESYQYAFVNVYEPLYGELTVTKAGISDQQSTVFRIEGTAITGEKVSLEIVLVGNEDKVIRHIPVGDYTVTELTDWSWRYELKSITAEKDQKAEEKIEDKKISFQLTSAGEHVTFTNKYDDGNWLSGDTYCKNRWDQNGKVQKISSNPADN